MDFFVGVLAGGKSTRFGSNKCLYQLGGQALISIILSQVLRLTTRPKGVFISLFKEERVSQLVSRLPNDQIESSSDGKLFYLKTPRERESTAIPVKFVFDEVRPDLPDIRAAIFGLASILNEVPEGGYVQVAPCDTPYFTAEVMDAMHDELMGLNERVDALVPRWRNGYLEPLHGIYTKEVIQRVRRNLGMRIFQLIKLFDEDARVRYFDIEQNLERMDPDLRAFKNFNDPRTS